MTMAPLAGLPWWSTFPWTLLIPELLQEVHRRPASMRRATLKRAQCLGEGEGIGIRARPFRFNRKPETAAHPNPHPSVDRTVSTRPKVLGIRRLSGRRPISETTGIIP